VTSIYSAEYREALDLLKAARKSARVTQQELADAIGRPQSFVSKYERGERRLDVVEFFRICRLVRADPFPLLKRIDANMD